MRLKFYLGNITILHGEFMLFVPQLDPGPDRLLDVFGAPHVHPVVVPGASHHGKTAEKWWNVYVMDILVGG